jgi:hypothetical protein
MIVAMIDANHISERLASLKLEMSDLGVANARYWSRKEHTALDKSASALRQQRLIQIKLELADMMKRCVNPVPGASLESRYSHATISIAKAKANPLAEFSASVCCAPLRRGGRVGEQLLTFKGIPE